MAATPQSGSFTFVGNQSKRIYTVDGYVSDVSAGAVTFSSQGAAGTGSLTFWKAPEQVTLIDFAMTTGTADTTNISMTSDGNYVPGTVLRYVPHVSTNAQRPALSVAFRAGSNIGAIQA